MIKLDRFIEEVNREEMWKTMEWLTRETPYRLAGSECEAKAAEYVTQRLREYGLEVVKEEFYTYNSDPLRSEVEILSPVKERIDSLPCAHIRATADEGEEFELVYVGSGSYADYEKIEAKGKLVLVEVSYAPPVPEKARIAYEMGAAGIVCMNWGNDEEVICHRGLKAVWGNPTEETFRQIPDLIGVGITRNAGLKLKEFCLAGQTVRLRVAAIADRKWSKVRQPMGILRGNGRHDQFLLVCSHLDAWQPGVTCNATGNATALEICRILSKHREELARDICFVFWNGHEIAEAAGSTWFVDHHWDWLNKKCISYMHIDSTGVGQTKIFEIKASEELLDFSKENFHSLEGESPIRAMALKKIGDQSFMGIGIPSVTQRMSFTEEDMERAHGATLGWWNHTCEDGLDKCDLDILETDTKLTLSLLYRLACSECLPYDFSQRFGNLEEKLEKLAEEYGTHLDFTDLMGNIKTAGLAVGGIQARRNEIEGTERVDRYNRFVMEVCRLLTNVVQTYAGKYQQDSYGYTKLSKPVPLLADLERLKRCDRESLEYGMIETQLVKNKNRINDALYQISELAQLTKEVIF